MSTCYSPTPEARTALAVTLCTPLARVALAAIRRESESRCAVRLGHFYEVRAADRALSSIRYTAAAALAAIENADGWVEGFGMEPFLDNNEARYDDIHCGALADALGRGLDSEQLTDDEHAALWPVYLPLLRAEIARLQRSKGGA